MRKLFLYILIIAIIILVSCNPQIKQERESNNIRDAANVIDPMTDPIIKGSLKKDSLVVVPKNFTLHKSILFKYIATLKIKKLNQIFQLFCKEIGCDL